MAQTMLITGANTGIGKAAAEALAAQGHRLYLACRSEDKTRPAIEEITRKTGNEEIRFLPLDLTSLASVRACAAEFLETGDPLDVLMNNAGVAGQQGLTQDGFELTFGVNHVGHFLLTSLLLERLRASAPSRIVNVSSIAHTQAKGIDWDAVRQPTKNVTALPEYAVSKLAERVVHPGTGAPPRGYGGYRVRTASRRDRIRHLGASAASFLAVPPTPSSAWR